MLIVILILAVVLAISLYSETHALGAWFWLLITHGFIMEFVGDSAEHMPMLAGLIIVATIVARRKWRPVPFSIFFVIGLMCLIMIAAALAGLDPARSLGKLFLYWKGFLLAILVAGTIRSEAQVRLLTIYCLAGVAIGVCVTIYEFLAGAYVLDATSIQRAGRLYGDPNVTATFLLVGLPLAIYWTTNSRRRSVEIICICLAGLILAGVVLTQSRSGFIATLIVLLFLYLKKPTVKGLVLGTAILGIGLWFAPPDYFDRVEVLIEETEQSGTQSRSLSLRAHFVRVGLSLFIQNPILGIGNGNFGQAMYDFDRARGEGDSMMVAHNMYLEFFVENGVFGGLLFLVLLAIAFIPALRYKSPTKPRTAVFELGFCVALSLFSALIMGLFLSLGKVSVLWYLVGLSMSFYVLSRSSQHRPNQGIRGTEYRFAKQ